MVVVLLLENAFLIVNPLVLQVRLESITQVLSELTYLDRPECHLVSDHSLPNSVYLDNFVADFISYS